jgi:isoleucyl-tRNA synthetase
MSTGQVRVRVDTDALDLGREDLGVRVAPVEGFGAAEERGLTVILNLEITEDLRIEGAAREVINRLQNLRKSAGLDVVDRIRLRYAGGEMVRRVFDAQGALIAAETLTDDMSTDAVDWNDTVSFDLEGETVSLWIQKSR